VLQICWQIFYSQISKATPRRLAAADEPHNFELRALADLGCGPIGFADDRAVELDRDARRIHLQEPKQQIHSEADGNASLLAIQNNLDRLCLRGFHQAGLTLTFIRHYI
jgi:hypothetical protein